MSSAHRETVRKNCDAMLNKDEWKQNKLHPASFDDVQNACLRARVMEPEPEIIERASGVVKDVLDTFKRTKHYHDWARAMTLSHKNPDEVYALMMIPKNVVEIANYLPNEDKGMLRRLLTNYLYKNKTDP